MTTDPDTLAPPLAPHPLRRAALEASALMKVLANPDRLLLLCELAPGERRVGDLEEATGIHQPTLSQQLTVLRSQGVVRTRREGKSIHYRIASPQVLAIMETLYQQFCGPVAADATGETDA